MSIEIGSEWVNKQDESDVVIIESVEDYVVNVKSLKEGSYSATIQSFLYFFKPIEANNGKEVITFKGKKGEYAKDEVVSSLNMLADICYSASERGGWWHDIETGEVLERNKLEMLMLIVSEVSEACEGVRKGINDDHLPQYRMEDVEIADAFIRCFDYIGGHGLKTAEAFVDKLIYNANREDHKVSNRLKEGGKKC